MKLFKFIQNQFFKFIYIFNTLFRISRNAKKWQQLKGKFAGKTAFLLGNGPSLNVTPLYLLRDEVSMCFNRFYLMEERVGWKPTFFLCTDPVVLPDIYEEIEKRVDEYSFPVFQEIHKGYFHKHDHVLYINELNPFRFTYPLPLVSRGSQTVAVAGLQVLFHLGFSKIVLLGVDQNYVLHDTAEVIEGRKIMSTQDDDPNHFDLGYFGKGRKYHNPNAWMLTKMNEGFVLAKKEAELRGVEMVNAGVGGKLEVYPRRSLEEVLGFSEEKRWSLFCHSIDAKLDTVLFRNWFNKQLTSEEPDESKGFFAKKNCSPDMIRKSLSTFCVYGPYDETHVFIQRERKMQNLASMMVEERTA
jgi:hypothetical protein